ncbi:MAG: ParB/RepB/Spo0J family partition protein [Elusimicrobiales bacterium]|nr:ParB/RepB/Spo0J family partition protein [Elusimicrobiales bacterium]
MAKESKTAAAPAAPQGYKELGRGDAPLDCIEVLPRQFRREFNPARLAELADSIAKVGVLEPILVRPGEENDGYHFFLVAGERRYRAAKMAGCATIPYRLLELNEEQAMEVMALENLHRADLGPVEEAQAFKTLIDRGGHTVEELAKKVDKSVGYVYRAVKLLELPEEMLSTISAGTLTAAHGHQLLRVPEKPRAEMIRRVMLQPERLTAASLGAMIDSELSHNLIDAIFPLDGEYAGQPACSNCPHNSNNEPALLADAVGGEESNCMNGKCYTAKTKRAQSDAAEKLKDKPENKGMQFLGAGKETWSNSGHGFKGKPILKDELKKKLAKELKTHPEKFGVGLNTQSGEPVYTIVDEELVERVVGKKSRTDDTDYERINYIGAVIKAEMLKAAWEKVKKPGVAEYVEMVLEGNRVTQYHAQLFGIKNDNPKTLSKLGVEKLARMAWLMSVSEHFGISDPILKRLKINPDKLRAEAKKAAGAEYDARKAAEAAKGKEPAEGSK